MLKKGFSGDLLQNGECCENEKFKIFLEGNMSHVVNYRQYKIEKLSKSKNQFVECNLLTQFGNVKDVKSFLFSDEGFEYLKMLV